MLSYTNIHSSTRPQDIEITTDKVIVAKNIHNYVTDDISGYEYNVDVYNKDEYILLLAQNQADIAALREELEAAKILLGVE